VTRAKEGRGGLVCRRLIQSHLIPPLGFFFPGIFCSLFTAPAVHTLAHYTTHAHIHRYTQIPADELPNPTGVWFATMSQRSVTPGRDHDMCIVATSQIDLSHKTPPPPVSTVQFGPTKGRKKRGGAMACKTDESQEKKKKKILPMQRKKPLYFFSLVPRSHRLFAWFDMNGIDFFR